MKKRIALTLMLLMALTALAAPALAETPVTITWGVYETDNLTAEVWQNVIDAFEKDNPGIKVEKVLASGDDRQSFWRSMFASGNFPDVVLEAETLAPIEGLFTEVPEDVLAQFDEAALVTFGGKHTIIPSMKQLRMQCYYNIAEFKALGLSEPKTWDEFLKVCETIKAAGKVPLICGGTGDVWATGAPWWISVVNQSILNAHPNFSQDLYNGTVKWNDESIVKSLTAWQDLVKAGYYYNGSMSLSYSQASAEFQNGTAVMMIDGSWMAAGLDAAKNTNFGVFAVPNPDGVNTYCTAISYWGVSASCQNKEAAFTFVKYVLGGNPDVYRGYLSADGLSSTTKTPVTYEQGLLMNKFVSNWSDFTLVPEITKVCGDYALPSGMENYINKSLQNIFSGSDIKTELDNWVQEYETLKEAA
jgi:ABC-type glycerol-3-phosphate transport system substrate-binding protein